MESYNCEKTRAVVSFPLVRNSRNDAPFSDRKTVTLHERKERVVGNLLPELSIKVKDNVFVRKPLSFPKAKEGIITHSTHRTNKSLHNKESHESYNYNNDVVDDNVNNGNGDYNDETYRAAMELLHTYAYRRKILTAATQVAERMKNSANHIAEWAEESQMRAIAQPINANNGSNNNNDPTTDNNNDKESTNNNVKDSRSSFIYTHENDTDKSESSKCKKSQMTGEEMHLNMNRTHGNQSIHDAILSSYSDEYAMDRITEQVMKDQSEENQAARGIALETRTDEENINYQVNDKVERLRRVRDLQRAIVELDDEIEEHRQELEQQQYEEEHASEQQYQHEHHRNQNHVLEHESQNTNAGGTCLEMEETANKNKMLPISTSGIEKRTIDANVDDNDNDNDMESSKNNENSFNNQSNLQTWHDNDNAKSASESASQSTLIRRLNYSIDAKSRKLSEMKVQLRALLREDDHGDDMRPPSPPSTFSSNALATTLEYMSSSLHELVNTTDKICVASVFKTRDEALSLTSLLHRMQQHGNYLLRCFDVAQSHATHFENGERALVEGGTFEVSSLRDKFLLRKETLTAQKQREKLAEESSNNLRARLRHLRRRCDMWEELFFHRTPIVRESDEYVIIDDNDDVDDTRTSESHSNDVVLNKKGKTENIAHVTSEQISNGKGTLKEYRHHSSALTFNEKQVQNTSQLDKCKNRTNSNKTNLQYLPNQILQEKFEKTESVLQRECKEDSEVQNAKFAATSPNAIWQVQKESRPLSSRNKSQVNEMFGTHAFVYSPQSTQPFRSTQVCLNLSEVEESKLQQTYNLWNANNRGNCNNEKSDTSYLNDAMLAELEREVADEWGNPYVKFRARNITALSTKPSFRRQSFTVARSRHNTCASLVDDNRPSSKTSLFEKSSNNNGNNNNKKESNELIHEAQHKADNSEENRNNALESSKFGGKSEKLSDEPAAAEVVSSSLVDHTMNNHSSKEQSRHTNNTCSPLPAPFSFDYLQHNASHETHIYNTSSSNTNGEINVLSYADIDSNDDQSHICNYDIQPNDRSFLFEISAETKATAEARALSLLQNLLHTLPTQKTSSTMSSHKNNSSGKNTITNTPKEENVIDGSSQNVQMHAKNDDSSNSSNDNVRASVQRLIRYLL